MLQQYDLMIQGAAFHPLFKSEEECEITKVIIHLGDLTNLFIHLDPEDLGDDNGHDLVALFSAQLSQSPGMGGQGARHGKPGRAAGVGKVPPGLGRPNSGFCLFLQ